MTIRDSRREECAGIIIGALQVARERVTEDTIEAKQARRGALREAISRIQAWQDGSDEALPSAGELRELLRDPDDRVIRGCLEDWDGK